MSKKMLALYAALCLCLIFTISVWVLTSSDAKQHGAVDANVSRDPRAYTGSDSTGLAAALQRDRLIFPDSATRLRFKTITTDLGKQFYLTFHQPCAAMRGFLEQSGILHPSAPISGVQPDVAARVGWPSVPDAVGGDVRGASGGVGDGRVFELTTVGNNSINCILYYYSTTD